MAVGFDRLSSVRALQLSDGDKKRAVLWLLNRDGADDSAAAASVAASTSDVAEEDAESTAVELVASGASSAILFTRCCACYLPRSMLVSMSNDCSHRTCIMCLRSRVRSCIDDGLPFACPNATCNAAFDGSSVLPQLDTLLAAAYNDELTQRFLNAADNMIECPYDACSSRMSIDVRSVASIQMPIEIVERDSSGALLSRDAYVHFSRFRHRCPQCKLDFCHACLATPYHKGHTCASFKENASARHCRFCDDQLTAANSAVRPEAPTLVDVCRSDECSQRADASCTARLSCGHACGGVNDERVHLPCLDEKCVEAAKSDGGGVVMQVDDVNDDDDGFYATMPPFMTKINESIEPAAGKTIVADDYCTICYTEAIKSAPAVRLRCGDTFHRHCLETRITTGSAGMRLSFAHLNCAQCNQMASDPALATVLQNPIKLLREIETASLARLKLEKMEDDPRLTTVGDHYYKKPLEYAMKVFAFYNCFKCKRPYFGGRRACDAVADEKDPKEFVCMDCSDFDFNAAGCSNVAHREYHTFKCRFCCNVAVWFCFGTTHFCDACHKRPVQVQRRIRSKTQQCKGDASCMVKRPHGPNGPEVECEFNMGCSMCAATVDSGIGGAIGAAPASTMFNASAAASAAAKKAPRACAAPKKKPAAKRKAPAKAPARRRAPAKKKKKK
jgi:E3 ubiquitin-protein ligase MYCBP2